MLTPKFTDAFNECADKIVNAAELMKLSFAEYASALSPDEHALITSLKSKTAEAINAETMSILGDFAKRKRLMDAIGDGTIGIYACADNQVFVNARFVRFMEETLRVKTKLGLSPDLLAKLDNADADALRKAPDYKDKVAALRLRAFV